MPNILQELWYDVAAARAIRHPERLPYYAEELNAAGVRQARQLIAEVYAAKGVVPAASLQPDGTMPDRIDPYWRHSTYYGVRDRRRPELLLMAARLIHPTTANGVRDLQLHLEDLTPRFRAKLLRARPEGVAELAAYIKQPGLGPLESRLTSLYLIRKLVQDSQANGVRLWVFGMRPELRKKYERLFGPAMDRQGDHVRLGAFNAQFVPYSIDVARSCQHMLTASRWRPGSKAIAQFTAAAYANKSGQPTLKPRPSRIKPAH